MVNDDRQWAHEELDRQVDELKARSEWREDARLRISNPVCREFITRLIEGEIWPGIQKILGPTDLVADLCSEDGRPNISEEPAAIDMSMSFVMLIASENTSCTNAPYFCRIWIECSSFGFMVKTDFYVHFPEDFDFEKLKTVMGHEKFAGNPPELKYEIGDDLRPGELILCFKHGNGYTYPVPLPVDTMLSDFAERINFLRRLIRSAEHLSQDYADVARFDRLSKELVKCFEAW